MTFEWDVGKAKANLAKHGVSFEEAKDIFAAPAVFEDVGHSETEARYLAIGFSAKSRVLTVVFVRLGENWYRIISARCSTKKEQALYAKEKQQGA